MKSMTRFMRHLRALPIGWQVWIAFLLLANFSGIAYLPRPEAWIVLAGIMVGGLGQMLIFSKLGFVRLLGLGHFHWLPMVVWLTLGLKDLESEPSVYYWVLAVVAVDSLSLLIDLVDVGRYLAGERQPTIVPDF